MSEKYGVSPGQSIALLKERRILTRDGKMNQDSRRKLKQGYHLHQFIEPPLQATGQDHADIIASYKNLPRKQPVQRLNEVPEIPGLEEMRGRFFV